jgi:hypothetical protein
MAPPFFNHKATGSWQEASSEKPAAKILELYPRNCWILKPEISILSPVPYLPQRDIPLSHAVGIQCNYLISFTIKTIKF